jgi:hypothetical protein
MSTSPTHVTPGKETSDYEMNAQLLGTFRNIETQLWHITNMLKEIVSTLRMIAGKDESSGRHQSLF